jgi:Tol biopolymer transport system component
MPALEPSANDKLESWKEIASHFKRGVTTVQRWEKEEGLPVHRHRHARQGSIYAFRTELDAWRAGRGQHAVAEPSPPAKEPLHRNPRWVVIAAAGVVIGVSSFLLYPRTKAPEPEIVPLTADPGSEYDPSLSPDGRRVVYAATGGQCCSLLLRSVGAGQSSRLSAASRNFYSPKWSPDGKWIAAIRTVGLGKGKREVILIPAQGGSERVLTSMEGVWLAWTPDSRAIGVIDRGSPEDSLAVHLVSIRDGSRRRLTNPPAGYWGDISCAFSADGKWLAVLRYSIKGKGDVYVMKADGTGASRLTHDETWVTGMDWTPDSREIVYGGVRRTDAGLWRIEAAGPPGASPVFIPGTTGRSLSPSLSRTPDGSAFRIAYHVEPFMAHIWKWEVGVGTPSRITNSTRTDESPAISRDGKKIAFTSTRSGAAELWECDSDGTNPVRLTSTKSLFTQEERWSPDGSRLVFVSQSGARSVYVLNINGGSPRRITTGSFDEGYPTWSADGRWIYFRSDRSGRPQIWKAPSGSGGEPVQVTRNGAVEGIESADGKLLYFVKGPDEMGLWSVPSNGGEEHRVTVLTTVRMGYWDVAAEGVVFIDVGRTGEGARKQVIKLFRPDSGEVLSLGEFSSHNIFFNGFSVTRDGRTVLWNQVEPQTSDLMMIDNFR